MRAHAHSDNPVCTHACPIVRLSVCLSICLPASAPVAARSGPWLLCGWQVEWSHLSQFCLSVGLYACPACPSVRPLIPLRPPVHPTNCLSVCLFCPLQPRSPHLPVSLSARSVRHSALSICPLARPPVGASFHSSVCPSVRLSVHAAVCTCSTVCVVRTHCRC